MSAPAAESVNSAGTAAAAGRWTARVGSVEVHFGEGRLAEIGEVVRALGGRRVLLVTDPGVRRAGHAGAALQVLTEAGLTVALFDGVGENPTSREVEAGAAFARGRDVDFLVAVGGGSAMDCAKGINFLLTNGGRIEDYHGFGRAGRPMLPSIGVPTTAGTGSEAQSYALISDPASHRKMACGDDKARFRAVVLDPELTATTPFPVAAASGLDAVAHAVESYVSTRANPVSRMLAKEAWRLLAAHLEETLAAAQGVQGPQVDTARENGQGDAAARGAVLLGAHLAGAAIEQSMLGAAHACANPLTARYGVVHGQAVALMLPAVVRFNGAAAEERYAELAGGPDAAERLAVRIEVLRAAGGLPARLSERGVELDLLGELAADAAEQWTGRFNPRPVTRTDLRRLYEAAW